jgi:DNA-binding response OmpR family regulator
MKILLIEDDSLLAQGISTRLSKRGHQLEWFNDGQQGLTAVLDLQADIILLDLNLPKVDGLKLLSEVRAKGITTPVLIITARDAIDHRIKGLDYGADDYLVKPFSIDELDARLRALYRRAHGRCIDKVIHQEILIDTQIRQVFFRDNAVDLGRREYDLLLLLLDNKDRVLTRRQLEEQLYDEEPESNALEVHVHNLRKKLGKKLINTVRGVGYFVAA